MLNRILTPLSTVFVVALSISSCNVFTPFDEPTSDEQILSAARACFDRLDFDCAKHFYNQLSGDTANAEQGFIVLDEQGASMAAYMEFIGNLIDKGTGPALTIFANRMAGNAGPVKRQAIWQIYSNAVNASTGIKNKDAQNFVVFVTATALAAEMLAESASGGSQVIPGDLAKTPSGCHTAGACNVAACAQPTVTNLVTAAQGPLSSTTSPGNSQATIRWFYDAIKLSLNSLQALGASGKFSTAVNAFSSVDQIVQGIGESNLDTAPNDRCFREQLIELDFGTS